MDSEFHTKIISNCKSKAVATVTRLLLRFHLSTFFFLSFLLQDHNIYNDKASFFTFDYCLLGFATRNLFIYFTNVYLFYSTIQLLVLKLGYFATDKFFKMWCLKMLIQIVAAITEVRL